MVLCIRVRENQDIGSRFIPDEKMMEIYRTQMG